MKQIKFRFWDKENKRFSETPNEYKIGDINFYTDYEIMQFTGLKDKNDKDVYEGDLIRQYDDNSLIYLIGFSRSSFCYFNSNDLKRNYHIGTPIDCEENGLQNCFIEVIGNIYENPNLIDNGYINKNKWD